MRTVTAVFSGPQGSGKGTQLALLTEFLKKNSDLPILFVDMGALLRRLLETKSFAANTIKEVMDSGYLLPSVIPTALFSNEIIQNLQGNEHVILDGVARKVRQSQMLHDLLRFFGRYPYDVVVLEIPKEESIKRLQSRSGIEGRTDDSLVESVQRRLDLYEMEVVPAQKEFEKFGTNVHYIDGLGSTEEVHQRVLKALQLT